MRSTNDLLAHMVEAYINRGRVRGLLDDWDGALADLDQAIKLEPDTAGLYFSRGVARIFLNDGDGALADLDQALALDPNLAEAYFARGLINRCRGRVEKSLADFRRYVELVTDTQSLADAKKLIAELEAMGSEQ